MAICTEMLSFVRSAGNTVFLIIYCKYWTFVAKNMYICKLFRCRCRNNVYLFRCHVNITVYAI